MRKSPPENVAFEFVSASPTYLDALSVRRQVVRQVLFCEVLLSRHIIVIIRLLLGRILVLFYQRSDSHMSLAVHALLMCMLTSLSVDKVLLSRYIR